MYINSLELSNYRNYDHLYVDFDKGTTILYGDNAQGKTNILEALYLSSTTKSHRGSKDRDIIKFDREESHIKVNVSKHDINHKIDMHLRKIKSKGVAIDGMSIKKSGDLFGILNIIFFSPEDLGIVKDSPAIRRRFIDLELCQLNKLYYFNYTNYNKTLIQRNNLLKKIYFKPDLIDTLDVWDQKLVEYGCNIIKYRGEFIEMLNDIIIDIHSNITGGKEKIFLSYDKNVDIKDYQEMLISKRQSDLKYQTTQVGPHRDDMSFLINSIDVKKYGSQGQQRTAVLSLKLAQIELVRKITRDNPILLLDDVMSELDHNRKDYLLKSIDNIQTIITCTGYDDFIKSRMVIDKVYRVKDNNIYQNEI